MLDEVGADALLIIKPAAGDTAYSVSRSDAFDAEEISRHAEEVSRRAREVSQRAEDLLAEGDSRSARKIVSEAIDSLGRTADLMWALAEVEFADGDFDAGDDAVSEALAVNPHEPSSVAKKVRLLFDYGRWRDALFVAETLQEEVRCEPPVRTAIGKFYQSCGCPAHAVSAYRPFRGLPRNAQVAALWCWLRSGGPWRFIRSRADSWEEIALGVLSKPDAYIESISDIDKRTTSTRGRFGLGLRTTISEICWATTERLPSGAQVSV